MRPGRVRRGQVQIGRADQLALGHDHRPFHTVFQFADIARPAPFVDRCQRIGGKAFHRRVHLFGEPREERLGEQGRIARAFGKARNAHHDLGEAIKQVFAEAPRHDHRFEILVRRADDPGIDRDRFARPDPLDHPFLQKAQQLHLQRQGNVANLVEEQRAAAGHFDLALGGLDRPGERSFFVPEQLAFEQVFGNRRAVDRDKRSARAVARIVQPPREQLFAGPACAEQHHRHIGVRDPLDRPGDLDHFGRSGDHPPEHAVVLAAARRKLAVFALDLVQLQSAPHDQPQGLDIERFLVEVVSALGDRLQCRAPRTVTRCDDDLGIGLERHDRIEHGKAFARAVGIGWQAKIERDHRRFFAAQGRDRAGLVADDDHLEIGPGPFQLRLQAGIVLDDQQFGFDIRHQATLFSSPASAARCLINCAASARGRRTVNRVPSPSRLSTSSRPCIARTSSRAS